MADLTNQIRIENSSVRLRPFSKADVELIRTASEDQAIRRISGIPSACTEEQARAYIREQNQTTAGGVSYSFAIATVKDNVCRGHIGVRLHHDQRASLGYWLAPQSRGQGYGSSAVKLAARWATSALGVERLELYVEPNNTASQAVAKRAGFTSEGLMRSWRTVECERRDMLMFSLLASEIEPT